MTENAIEELMRLKRVTRDDFERRLFAAILACVAAAKAADEPVDDDAAPVPNIFLSDERQREICLRCPLADCVGIAR